MKGEAKCIVRAKASDYEDVELGRTNPQMAVMMGKIKIWLLIVAVVISSIPYFYYSKRAQAANITATNIDSKSASDTTSIVSNSITPASNALILAVVSQRTNISADPSDPTLTGNGLTWVEVNTVVYDTTSTSRRRVSVFRAMGASPTTGSVTADFAGQANTHSILIIDQFANMDTSGTNGSGAIVQSVTAVADGTPNTTLTATLAAFGNANNATYGGLAAAQTVGDTFTAGANFAITAQANNGNATGGGGEFYNGIRLSRRRVKQ